MVIEIESVYGDKIVFGKAISFPYLKSILNEISADTDESDFPSIFCSRLNYEEMEYLQETIIDYVIDLDTHAVYKPHY